MPSATDTAPLFFRSGCSNIADFHAAVRAGVPVGISLAVTSGNVLKVAADYLSNGGHVFVDSGAFGAFRRGERMGDTEFARHIRICLDLARLAQPGCLFAVSPDVIADQGATIELLRRYASQLTEICDTGAVLIVPLQKGSLPIAEFYALAQSILSPYAICAGLPSCAAALGSDEVMEFVRAAHPPMVHFLGAAYNKRFQALLADVRAVSPSTRFTYDATVLRAICGEIGRSPEKIHDAALEALDTQEIDHTELSPLLNADDPVALRAFAETMGISEDKAREMLPRLVSCGGDEDTSDDEAFTMNAMLNELWSVYAEKYAKIAVSGTWRTRALAAHPSFRTAPHTTQGQALLAL
jgi:hypothetical protein